MLDIGPHFLKVVEVEKYVIILSISLNLAEANNLYLGMVKSVSQGTLTP